MNVGASVELWQTKAPTFRHIAGDQRTTAIANSPSNALLLTAFARVAYPAREYPGTPPAAKGFRSDAKFADELAPDDNEVCLIDVR